ncbi:MAG TPA: DUF4157 domain-containing protein [Terriglobia bacterium]|nr:DUF4157 domain-containing protein [Terriglobia bacterium]
MRVATIKQLIQRKSAGETLPPDLANLREVLTTERGSQLDPSTRQFMEARLGFNFHNVRIHDESRAAASAGRLMRSHLTRQ